MVDDLRPRPLERGFDDLVLGSRSVSPMRYTSCRPTPRQPRGEGGVHPLPDGRGHQAPRGRHGLAGRCRDRCLRRERCLEPRRPRSGRVALRVLGARSRRSGVASLSAARDAEGPRRPDPAHRGDGATLPDHPPRPTTGLGTANARRSQSGAGKYRPSRLPILPRVRPETTVRSGTFGHWPRPTHQGHMIITPLVADQWLRRPRQRTSRRNASPTTYAGSQHRRVGVDSAWGRARHTFWILAAIAVLAARWLSTALAAAASPPPVYRLPSSGWVSSPPWFSRLVSWPPSNEGDADRPTRHPRVAMSNLKNRAAAARENLLKGGAGPGLARPVSPVVSELRRARCRAGSPGGSGTPRRRSRPGRSARRGC